MANNDSYIFQENLDNNLSNFIEKVLVVFLINCIKKWTNLFINEDHGNIKMVILIQEFPSYASFILCSELKLHFSFFIDLDNISY